MSERPKSRLPALTSLRFFAALCIVILHATNHGLLPAAWATSLDFSKAVSFFFVLSGFVLSYAYHNRKFTLKQFYLARWARIWPAATASTLMVPLLLPRNLYLPGEHGIWSEGLVMLATILSLQAWIPVPAIFFGFNAVTWSISVEIGFYLFFPWLQKRVSLLSVGFVAALCLALGLGLGLVATRFEFPGFSPDSLNQAVWQGFVYINPLARLWEFFAGILAARWFLSDQACALISRLRAFAKTSPYVLDATEFAIFALLIIVPLRHLPSIAVLPMPVRLVLDQWCAGAVFAALVIVAAMEVGRFSQFLNWNPLIFLGEISYGLYLYHQPLMIRAAQAGGLQIAGIQLLPASFGPVLAWSLALSLLSWAVIERPVVGVFKRVSSRPSPGPGSQPLPSASPVSVNPVSACRDTRTHL